MLIWRDKIERWFEALGHWLFHNRIKLILLIFLVVVSIVPHLRKITINTSSDSFFHENDPALLDYNAYRDQFGSDDRIFMAISAPDVFDKTIPKKLQALHADLEDKVPYVDDITSLINARNTRGEADFLIVEDLLEHWPQNEAELKAIKDRALHNPIYKNMLLSEDGTFTTIIIQLDAYSSKGTKEGVLEGFDERQVPVTKNRLPQEYLTDEENSEAVDAVKEVIKQHISPDFKVYVAGSSVVMDTVRRAMKQDISKFTKMVVFTVAVFLMLIFRRISGVVLPLFTVILSLLCTLGLMGLTGTKIKMPTQVLPSFLLAIGVGASVHLLAIFYKRFDTSGDKEKSLAFALGHSGLAIIMTSLTTMVGVGSFSLAEIAPIADLGIFASIGVFLSLIFTIMLLPALVAFFPVRRKVVGVKEREPLMDRLLTANANFSVRHARKIVFISSFLIITALISASQLRFSHHFLKWFPESDPVRKSTEVIDKNMRGSISMEVIIDTKRENGLHDPKVLNALDELCAELETLRGEGYFIGKAWSLPTILKEINMALNENRPGFYAIPQDRSLIAQELLLFENSGSDDLEDVVDSQFSKARLTIKLPWVDAVKYEEIIERVRERVEEKLGNFSAVTITGISPLFGRTLAASIESAAKSYLIAFVAITLMMILLTVSIRIGLLSMIPNLFPILVVMAVMFPFHMPLDMFTMLVGSIAIGLAVDNTIHFVHNFRRYHQRSGDAHEAVRLTFTTTGRAMLTSSVVLSLGFFVYMFAYTKNIYNFGLLSGLAIIVATLSDFFLMPALMVLITKDHKGGKPL
jgi:hypothetical protein